MRERPYQIVNLTNNETVEWCTYEEYVTRWAGVPNFDVLYRPGRKTTKKKEFPYNG